MWALSGDDWVNVESDSLLEWRSDWPDSMPDVSDAVESRFDINSSCGDSQPESISLITASSFMPPHWVMVFMPAPVKWLMENC